LGSELLNQKTYVDTTKRCQRNWDNSFELPKEHLEHLIYVASNSPTKQYEAYFDLYVISNREKLEELTEYTWGFTFPISEGITQEQVPTITRNPQTNASAYFLWVSKYPEDSNRNFLKDGQQRPNNHRNRKDNSLTSIGISMGMTSFCAASLGYVTAFNKNHAKPGTNSGTGEYEDDDFYWKDALGIDYSSDITFGLGIGKGKNGYQHYESDEHRLMVGHPKMDIIDINNTQTFEYNGQTYNVRDKITFPSFSTKKRDIKVKWIQ